MENMFEGPNSNALAADKSARHSRLRLKHPAAEKGKKIVVVIGGGFAGLSAAQALSGVAGVHVILVDQRNHHLFQPLLYQVATAGLNPSDIAVPIRSQFSNVENVEVHMARVDSIDLKEKLILFEKAELLFDSVIVATGARHSYFNHPEWEPFAPGLKTLEQATEIRRRILLAFENAEDEFDEIKRNALMTFVVVGGGPTGVEMAGAIADISNTVLDRDFKLINTKNAKVILIEAGSRILAAFDEGLSAKAASDLRKLGVDVRAGQRVEDIDANGVRVAGIFIPAKTVIWAAGVQAAPLRIEPPIERDRSGRVNVGVDFSIAGFPDAFVVGDMAAFQYNGASLPGLAPAAIQSGAHAARMIERSLNGERRTAFEYMDKGMMATIGKRKAIAQAGQLRLTGFIAWLAWLFIHILYLVGFKNRFSVLLLWFWSYSFAKRGARLITDKEWRQENLLPNSRQS